MICDGGMPPGEPVYGVCRTCGHAWLVHSRRPAEDGQTCVLCALSQVVAQLAVLGHRED